MKRVCEPTRRSHSVLAAGACLLLAFSAACSSGGNNTLTGGNVGKNGPAPKGSPPPVYGANLKGTLTIGEVISSAGPGKDFQPLAAGVQVVPALVGGNKVKVVVQDDQGTPAGATAAVDALVGSGATYIVYGSVGAQVDAGIREAATKGVTVMLPYDGTTSLTNNANGFMIALPNNLVPQKLADYTKKARSYDKYAVVWDTADPYAVSMQADTVGYLNSQNMPPVAQVPFGPNDSGIPLMNGLQPVGNAAAQATFVLGDASATFRVLNAWQATGLSTQMMVSPRAAVPNFGAQDINQLTPPVRNGTLSVGIAGGPWNPTPAVQNFYVKRNQVKGTTPTDMSWADVISADAGLLGVAAAGKGTSATSIASGMKGLKFQGIGANYSFAGGHIGVTMSDYAVTYYERETSAQGTYVGQQFPNVQQNGGFWVAVPGSSPAYVTPKTP